MTSRLLIYPTVENEIKADGKMIPNLIRIEKRGQHRTKKIEPLIYESQNENFTFLSRGAQIPAHVPAQLSVISQVADGRCAI